VLGDLSEDLTPKTKQIKGRVKVGVGFNRRKMRRDQKKV
jgi:hypothetical protein